MWGAQSGKLGLSSGDTNWNLEDYVMDLFDRKETKSDEFTYLLRVFGRQKMEEIYKKYLSLKNSTK